MESAAAAGLVAYQINKGTGKNSAASTGQTTTTGYPSVTQEERDIIKSICHLSDMALKPMEFYFNDDSTLDMVKMKNTRFLEQAKQAYKKQSSKIEIHFQGKQNLYKALRKDVKRFLYDLDNFLIEMDRAAESCDVDQTAIGKHYIELQEMAEELGPVQAAAIGTQIHQTPSPGLIERAKSSFGSCRISETHAKAMVAKLELRKEQLRTTELRAEELRKRKLEKNKELHRVLRELSNLKEEQMTKQQILSTIVMGLRALYELRQQWTKLFLYFKTMDNLLQAAMGPAMIKFSNVAEIEGQRVQQGQEEVEEVKEMSTLIKDRLFKTVTNVVVTSRVVHFLSKSYLSLSNDHLMPMISEFGKLIALDSSDKNFLATKHQELMSRATDAQVSIREIIEAKHFEFRRDLYNRRKAIEEIYEEQPAIQNLTEPKRLSIQEQVQKRFQKAQARMEDLKDDDDFCQ